jgi:hypothetical protein
MKTSHSENTNKYNILKNIFITSFNFKLISFVIILLIFSSLLSFVMAPEHYSFSISNKKWSKPIDAFLKSAKNGETSKHKTDINLKYDSKYLHIEFTCFNDPYLAQNNLTKNNDPLYNQEVFELFISPGANDPTKYLEIEINPNNAIWVGKMSNPSLGKKMQTIETMVAFEETGIIKEVKKINADSWKGKLSIPWNLIGESPDKLYRLNFYRIIAREKPTKADWICNDLNSDFLCWSPTMSGSFSAFHRPKKFGLMQLK